MYEVQNQSSIFYVFFFIDLSLEGLLHVAGLVTSMDINIGGDGFCTTGAEDRGVIKRLHRSTRGLIYRFLSHKGTINYVFHKFSIFKYQISNIILRPTKRVHASHRYRLHGSWLRYSSRRYNALR